MSKRRTNPSYLSDEEATRESERLREMVRSIGRAQTIRLGETDNFIVDFDGDRKLVIIYGKEVPVGSSFKFGFSRGQAVGIRNLLKRAIDVMQGTESVKIGEESGFVVDYDGKLVMLHGRDVKTECLFGLAFDKDDIVRIIFLLRGYLLAQASGVKCPKCHKQTLVVVDDRYEYGAICFECGYKS